MSKIKEVREKIAQYGLMAMTDSELLTATKYSGTIADYYDSFDYKAAKELQRRKETPERISITKSQDIADVFSFLQTEEYEQFWVAYLSATNKVIKTMFVTKGTSTATIVNKPLIIREALNCNAKNIILAHNHPSGSLRPSEADTTITRQMHDAAKLFDIKILDHVIITNNGYYSFADEGIL